MLYMLIGHIRRGRHRVHFEVLPIVPARDAVMALEPLLED